MSRLKSAWNLPKQIKSVERVIPSESQLLRSTPMQEMGGGEVELDEVEQAWRVPFTPDEFVAEAFKSGHPKNFPV